MIKFLFLFLFLQSLIGCSILRKDAILSSDQSLADRLIKQNPQAKFVRGEDCQSTYIILPLGFPTEMGAYEAALAQAPGANTLLDARFSHTVYYAFLYMRQCLVYEGYAIHL